MLVVDAHVLSSDPSCCKVVVCFCSCWQDGFLFVGQQPPPPLSVAFRSLWLSAPHGRLSPWQQARALALREASRELHSGRTQLEWVAARVKKVGGGSPGQDALHKFFKLVDSDLTGFLVSNSWGSVADLRC